VFEGDTVEFEHLRRVATAALAAGAAAGIAVFLIYCRKERK